MSGRTMFHFHGFEKLPYIATGIHDCGAALLQHNSLLSWIQVRELINVDEGDDLTDQRARAILLLCAVYGLRAREVVRLGPDTVSYTTEVINTRGRIATDLLNARSRLT